jgi:tRNA modification GTPase
MVMDTIFALSSGSGRAGVAVIRLSGPRAGEAVRVLAGAAPPPRRAALRTLRDSAGEPIDQALVLWLPGPGSFTGEDMAELHCHGSRAVLARLTAVLAATEGLRPAEAGEFTRRALVNGRMDLTEAEALADLIAAETEAQRRQALGLARGALRERVGVWRDVLLRAMALVESSLDFADEGDVEDERGIATARRLAGELAAGIAGVLGGARRGERLREGFTVVIAGPPNAGKSTLLNALARRDVAIVSDRPGTTRDVIEVHLDLDGLPVTVVDTAGLRDSDDAVEAEGIRRARRRAEDADLVLWLSETGEVPPSALDAAWPVQTKIDSTAHRSAAALALSARSGEGVAALLGRLVDAARAALGHGDALVARERQRLALERAASALGRASAVADPELMAEDLRAASAALAAVVGAVGVEDVLDTLFSEFCIGK